MIGGGAAGLSAVSALVHRDVVLLERGDRLGGRLYSLQRGQEWINLGAHLLTGGPSKIKDLVARCQLEVRTIPGVATALWFGGRLHKHRRVELYPLTLALTLRQRVDLVRLGLRLRFLAAEWRRVSRRRKGESGRAYTTRMRGHRSDATFESLLDGCDPGVADIFRTAARRSAGEASQMTVGGAAALFGALWVGDGSSSVVNVVGGSGRVATAMEKQLRGCAVLSAEVTEVVELGDRVEVTYRTAGTEQRVSARYAIVATPAFEAARIATSLPAPVAEDLASVEYGPFVCLGVLTSPLADLEWDDVYAIAAPDASFDMLFNHTNPFRASGSAPSRRSLMCYAGGRRAQQLLELSDSEIERTFMRDLIEVLPEVAGAVDEAVVSTWRAGNCLASPDTRLDRLEQWNARPDGRLFLAGDYFAPLGGTIEAATVSGLISAEMVLASARWSPAAAEPRTSPENGPAEHA